jgi:hypothetical protein
MRGVVFLVDLVDLGVVEVYEVMLAQPMALEPN